MELSGYKTTLLANFNLSNLVQHLNTNMTENVHAPTCVSANLQVNYRQNSNKAVIKHFCEISLSLNIILWKLKESQDLHASFLCTFKNIFIHAQVCTQFLKPCYIFAITN